MVAWHFYAAKLEAGEGALQVTQVETCAEQNMGLRILSKPPVRKALTASFSVSPFASSLAGWICLDICLLYLGVGANQAHTLLTAVQNLCSNM